jgi:hypothetical protein
MNINDRVTELESTIKDLVAKIADLSQNTEERYKKPISIVGGITSKAFNRPNDIRTGKGLTGGGSVVWNDSESKRPPYGHEPSLPTVGYNRHSHSRYAGGALIKDCLEILEYNWNNIINKDSQQYWATEPQLEKMNNTNGEAVDKIGPLDLIFDPDTRTWGTSAKEIDIETCYLVQYDRTVNPPIIKLDSKGNEMKSTLYNSDPTKSSIVWDENASVWRLYAVYAPGEPTP